MDTLNSSQASPIAFNAFWQMVANELGDARLKLNPKAKQISAFIHGNSDIQSYLHDTIRKSYKLSGCQNLASPISLSCVFDLLGEAAYSLQQRDNCDLFDIELLEEVAWLISDRYSLQVGELVQQDIQQQRAESIHLNTPSMDNKATKKATIVSFPGFKQKRANALL